MKNKSYDFSDCKKKIRRAWSIQGVNYKAVAMVDTFSTNNPIKRQKQFIQIQAKNKQSTAEFFFSDVNVFTES